MVAVHVGWCERAVHRVRCPDSLAVVLAGALVTIVAASSAQAADGSGVSVWGDNSYDQGDVPRPAAPATAIAAGGGHTLAVKTDGTVSAWVPMVMGRQASQPR